MALCITCGGTFSNARKSLGYNECLGCGDKTAQQETERLKRCTAPAFNKGPYQPVTSTEQAKWLGRK